MERTAVSKIESSNGMEYEPLVDYEDIYEIALDYPYPIRRIKDKYTVKEWYNDGYICLNLNNWIKRSTASKHVLVAIQFIPNDDPINKKFVDHINHNRSDYHISNLRWCTKSTNERNKSSYNGIECEYIDFDDLSDEAIEVTYYANYEFEDYIFDPETDKFNYFTGDKCRTLHINVVKKTGALFVYMRDINNNRVKVYYNKFKKLYGFI